MRTHGDKSLHIGTGGNKMISLDKAIEFYKGYKDRSGGTVDYNEFDEQLADWLEELKYYRDKSKMVVHVNVENMDSIKYKIDELSKYAESQYNKAIDDFVKMAYEELLYIERLTEIDIAYIAEQLKAGANNGTDNQ